MPKLIKYGVKADMILADLPYGTTACSWDTVIPFEPLWDCYKGLIKDNGAIVLFGSQPFTSLLICSNLSMFKYEWTWEKSVATNHLNAKIQPLRITEQIAVFYQNKCTYNPQGLIGGKYKNSRPAKSKFMKGQNIYGKQRCFDLSENGNYPQNILRFGNGNNESLHPTQKPVDLIQYLILTYTNEGETVLDNTMGSGTTGVACMKTGRKFIGIEKEQNYFNIAEKRIKEEYAQTKLF